MIKDVDKLAPDDLLVVDLTAKEALLLTALPAALAHYAQPHHTAKLKEDKKWHELEVLGRAISMVATRINDGTLNSVMNKLNHSMEVAVYLRKQK